MDSLPLPADLSQAAEDATEVSDIGADDASPLRRRRYSSCFGVESGRQLSPFGDDVSAGLRGEWVPNYWLISCPLQTNIFIFIGSIIPYSISSRSRLLLVSAVLLLVLLVGSDEPRFFLFPRWCVASRSKLLL